MFSVHQHWDPLKVCAVGRSYPPEFYAGIKNPKVRSVMERIAIETEEDYQKLIKKLEQFGVTVLRTDISDNFEDHVNADGIPFSPPMCPKDYTAMIGNTFYMPGENYGNFDLSANIVERYGYDAVFYVENLPEEKKKEIIESIIKSEMQTSGPILRFPSNKKYCSFSSIKKFLIENKVPIVYDEYMNTACMTRLGKDLYFSSINDIVKQYPDRLISKLQRLFPGYRTHILDIEGHSDGVFCPVKPGLILSKDDNKLYNESFPEWEVIKIDNKNWNQVKPFLDLKHKHKGKWWIPGEDYNDDLINYVETSIKDWLRYLEETVFDVNMLVIDEHNVICNNYNEEVFRAFERYDITPHVINFRHRFFWHGGSNRITSDIAREGKQKDYFPNRKGSSAILHPTPDKIVFRSW